MNEKSRQEWLNFLHYFTGSVYIPPELLRTEETRVLHISDTPGVFLHPLKNLIRKLKPQVIIHTGDLVDDIKLEFAPGGLYRYQIGLKRLFEVLGSSGAQQIIIVPGNHDHMDTIWEHSPGFDILVGERSFHIGGVPFITAHRGDAFSLQGKFHLYGHNPVPPSREEIEGIFLNGIQGIHVILLPSERVWTLPYPMGVNEARLNQGRISF